MKSFKKITIIFSSFVFAILLCMPITLLSSKANAQSFNNRINDNMYNDIAEEIVSKMSPEQRILQTFFMYFQHWDGSDFTEMNDEVSQILHKYNFGGVVYFASNCKDTLQTLNLSKNFQKESTINENSIPMLITVDQEGGRVVRLNTGTSMPGNMGLGATGDYANAYSNGNIIGSELESLAINTDYAPVVDINCNANNPVIAIRSFSDDANDVANFGYEYFRGLDNNNVIACAKHFPGHGDTGTDSHTGLPRIEKTWDELMSNEIIPFKKLIDNGIDMIMSAHIQFPNVDPSTVPDKIDPSIQIYRTATVSHKILTDYLKGDLGFDGVISTDGMHMAGITKMFDEPQACYEALKAGADMMCGPTSGENLTAFTNSINGILSFLEEKYTNEPGFSDRVTDAATRVVKLKAKRGILDFNSEDYTEQKALATVGNSEHHNIERDIAAKSVTVTKNVNNTLPLHINNESKVLFMCQNNAAEDLSAQMAIGWNRAKEVGLIPVGAQVNCVHFDENNYTITGPIKDAIDAADTIIVNSVVSKSSEMAYQNWRTAGVNNAVNYCHENNKKSIVMSNFFPYDVQLYPNADAIMALYCAKGSSENYQDVIDSGKVMPSLTFGPTTITGVEVAFGIFGASGKLPVDIPFYDLNQKKYTNQIVYNRSYGLEYDPITSMDAVNISLEFNEVEYDGSPKCPKVVCSTNTNKVLEEGVHYNITYLNNIEVGIASIAVTGIGSYVGQKNAYFTIVEPKPVPIPSVNNLGIIEAASNIVSTGDDTIEIICACLLTLTLLIFYIRKRFLKN